MKTLRNSAEKMPPFFIAPLFLILRDTERLGCLKWNSLEEEGEGGKNSTRLFCFFPFFPFFLHTNAQLSVERFFFFKYKELEIKARDPLHRVRNQRE